MAVDYKSAMIDATIQTTGTAPRNSTDVVAMLRAAGLRPTRQRMSLAMLLFVGQDRHTTAEQLHADALSGGERVSLATVYNTLHQFEAAGLLREIAVGGSRTYFDTNTSNHNHFYLEPEGVLVDIPSEGIRVEGLPAPPAGLYIANVDVVVRLVHRR